jgi:hypothetical protein
LSPPPARGRDRVGVESRNTELLLETKAESLGKFSPPSQPSPFKGKGPIV